MGLLIQTFRGAVNDAIPSDSEGDALRSLVVRAFNNDMPSRVKNRKPRTDLMIGGLRFGHDGAETVFTHQGLMARAAANGKTNAEEVGAADITIWADDWWQGKRYCRRLVEVENNWDELRGTLRDLFNHQAKQKWGIFYHNDFKSAIKEIFVAIKEVHNAFDESGFVESPSTHYEILLLPNTLPPSGFLGVPVAEVEFRSWQKTENAKALTMA